MSWVTNAKRIKSGLIMGFSDKAFTEKVQSKYDVLRTVLMFAHEETQWHDGDTFLIKGIEFDDQRTYMITGVVVEPNCDEIPYCVICNIISGRPFLTVIRDDDLALEQSEAACKIFPTS